MNEQLETVKYLIEQGTPVDKQAISHMAGHGNIRMISISS